jgi:hypothetical protein
MPKKVSQYDNERKEILNKLFNILNINEQNDMFSLHKIDNDVKIQQEILDLESDIRKYFVCYEWSCIKKKDIIKRRWLSFIKYILKDMNYIILTSNIISKNKNTSYVNKGALYTIREF